MKSGDRTGRAFEEGRKAAWRHLLDLSLRNPGEDPAAERSRWVSERADTVAMLRQVCEELGDNDRDDDLHLADVIEKHLWVHLPDPGEDTGEDTGEITSG